MLSTAALLRDKLSAERRNARKRLQMPRPLEYQHDERVYPSSAERDMLELYRSFDRHSDRGTIDSDSHIRRACEKRNQEKENEKVGEKGESRGLILKRMAIGGRILLTTYTKSINIIMDICS